jgi:hypothetical protein
MAKTKFQIGNLVKVSPRLTMSLATAIQVMHPSWSDKGRIEYYPTKYRKLDQSERFTLLDSDVGMVTRIEKYGEKEAYLYQVRFMQTGLDLVLHEREMKWAK